MAHTEHSEFIGSLLDAYSAAAWRRGVASKDPEDFGVPQEMQIGEVDAEGWVEWRVLPSTLTKADVEAVEKDFNVQFPPQFRAYLSARFQLFNQVYSRRYDQQILMVDTPAGRPLRPLRDLLNSWQQLLDTGFIPFAQWGDGWGPMCFDSAKRGADGDCPVVWMDHEALIPLGPEQCRRRESVLPLAQFLYGSCREFLIDVFGRD